MSIAHSYHRVCPSCAAEKRTKDEEQEREDKRRRGTELWREYSQSHDIREGAGEEDSDDDGDGHGAIEGRSGEGSLMTRISGDVGIQHRRSAALDLSEQNIGDRRAAAFRIARDLGIQLIPSDTIEGLEEQISAELRVRGAELVASDANGRSRRLGDEGWEAVPIQGPIRDTTPSAQPSRPQTRSQTRQARQSAATQTNGITSRMVIHPEGAYGSRPVGPRTRARQIQAQAERERIQLTAAQEARRRSMFEQAIAEERRRIEDALAADGLPSYSEQEMQRRFQPIRDLMAAPPILAAIQRAIPSGESSAAESLRTRADDIRRRQAQETEALRAENRQRPRRGAVAIGTGFASRSQLPVGTPEPGTSTDADAIEIDGERVEDIDSDEDTLSELEEIHGGTSTAASVFTATPARNRRSETPSPEDRGPPIRDQRPYDHHLCNSSCIHLPGKSLCAQHQDAGWESYCSRPSHAKPEDDVMKAHLMGLHIEHPRTYNKANETSVSDTWEILVHYDGCKHAEAVFVERLEHTNGSNITARCGCESFDERLVKLRQAVSRQKCLDCRTEDTIQRHSEQPQWFGRSVRKIGSQREYRLWPFGAKSNNGALEYR